MQSTSTPTETRVLSSEELRKRGNQWFAKYKEGGMIDSKKFSLHRAIDNYEMAKTNADKFDYGEIASNFKNIGVSFSKLEDIEARRDTALYYLKESTRALAKSLEYGELADKPQYWLQEIFQRLADTIKLFITRKLDLVENATAEILTCAKIDVKNPEYHRMICEHRIDESERMLAKCMQLVSEKNFRVALPALHELYFPLEEAELHSKGDLELRFDVYVLKGDTDSFLAIAEALQNYEFGRMAHAEAMMANHLDQKSDFGLQAIDHFKASEVLARSHEVEIVAMAQASIGITLYKVFRLRQKAKNCLMEAMNVSKVLTGTLYGRPWYDALTKHIQEIRDEEEAEDNLKWENRRKPYLDMLKDELDLIWAKKDDDPQVIVDFLFARFPPKHKEDATKPDETLEKKKKLLKLNQIYHPDKIDEEKLGSKYKVLCEEICKMINRRYECLKGEE